MGIVLTGGTVVTADNIRETDVRIEGEVVDCLGSGIAKSGDEVIDVAGCYLFPGGIDPHTHFDLDVGLTVTADDFVSGTRAAIAGGTTTVIDFATQSRGGSLSQALSEWHEKADGKSYTDYGFHLAVCDCNDVVLNELQTLVDVHGVSSVKMYMAYKGILQIDDLTLFKVLEACKKNSILPCVHAENGDVISVLTTQARDAGDLSPVQHAKTRPIAVEAEAVNRAITLSEIADTPLYVVHVSSGRALRLITEAKDRGLPVYAETCPQYLLLDETYYESEGFEAAKYVISPPLRSKNNQQLLWSGIANRSVSTVGSDHCSFNFHGQKELGRNDFSKIPNGAPGVENRFGLLYTFGVDSGKIDLMTFVAVTSCNAAKLFGLYPRKGTIQAGSDADIVVWDPNVQMVIEARRQIQNVDYNPYEGFVQMGWAQHVYLRGRQAMVGGKVSEIATGRYLPRTPFKLGGSFRV